MADPSDTIDVAFARDERAALRYVSYGYVPVECCFGPSVITPQTALSCFEHNVRNPDSTRFDILSPYHLATEINSPEDFPLDLAFDHHGTDLPKVPAPVMKAYNLRSSGEGIYPIRSIDDPHNKYRFVTTGSPDPDAIATICQLAGLVELSYEEARAIERIDVDPVGVDHFSHPFFKAYLFFHRELDYQYRQPLVESERVLRAINLFTTIYSQDGILQEDYVWLGKLEQHIADQTRKALSSIDPLFYIPRVTLLTDPGFYDADIVYSEFPIWVARTGTGKVRIAGCTKSYEENGYFPPEETAFELTNGDGFTGLPDTLDQVFPIGWSTDKYFVASPRSVIHPNLTARFVFGCVQQFLIDKALDTLRNK